MTVVSGTPTLTVTGGANVTSGTASIAGFDIVRDANKVRAHVGFLAASTALYGRLTAREMISYFGKLNGLSDADVRRRIKGLADEHGVSWNYAPLHTFLKEGPPAAPSRHALAMFQE